MQRQRTLIAGKQLLKEKPHHFLRNITSLFIFHNHRLLSQGACVLVPQRQYPNRALKLPMPSCIVILFTLWILSLPQAQHSLIVKTGAQLICFIFDIFCATGILNSVLSRHQNWPSHSRGDEKFLSDLLLGLHGSLS